jgi:hypothetical protein
LRCLAKPAHIDTPGVHLDQLLVDALAYEDTSRPVGDSGERRPRPANKTLCLAPLPLRSRLPGEVSPTLLA